MKLFLSCFWKQISTHGLYLLSAVCYSTASLYYGVVMRVLLCSISAAYLCSIKRQIFDVMMLNHAFEKFQGFSAKLYCYVKAKLF